MNLSFNAVMWGLFTRALTLASSTVRVSVINTSANFMLTAVLGAIIFSERLPGKPDFYHISTKGAALTATAGLWWLGAGMLVAGSVIIGRREEGKDAGPTAATGQGGFRNETGVPLAEGVSSDSELSRGESIELRRKAKGRAS